jgi:hypothetical protein
VLPLNAKPSGDEFRICVKMELFVDISFLEIGALIYLLIEENELKVNIL